MGISQGVGGKFSGQVKPSAIEVDAYEPDVFAHRITMIESNQQAIFDYGAGTIVLYAGSAPRGLGQATSGWLLRKFTYDGNNNVTQIQIAYDSWNNRATATYA